MVSHEPKLSLEGSLPHVPTVTNSVSGHNSAANSAFNSALNTPHLAQYEGQLSPAHEIVAPGREARQGPNFFHPNNPHFFNLLLCTFMYISFSIFYFNFYFLFFRLN